MHLVLDAMKYRKENHIIRPDMINMQMESRGMLKKNPDVQEKLLQETQDVDRNLDGKPLTYKVILNKHYMDMVVSETLRKWSVAPAMDRMCTDDITYELKTGQKLEIRKSDAILIPALDYLDARLIVNCEGYLTITCLGHMCNTYTNCRKFYKAGRKFVRQSELLQKGSNCIERWRRARRATTVREYLIGFWVIRELKLSFNLKACACVSKAKVLLRVALMTYFRFDLMVNNLKLNWSGLDKLSKQNKIHKLHYLALAIRHLMAAVLKM
ncbi:hypothetical protein GQX74_014235 [Glossina fuscipes]|nr:hypothetical protein GQX74_014235 [Glossina fuscipes]